jgi:hypothetical protein
MNAVKTIVTIGILVVLIAGITFVTQFVSTKNGVPQIDPLPPIENYLVFYKGNPEQIFAEMTPSTGYLDYFFRNVADDPVEVGLEWQSCKCAGIEVRNLNKKDEEHYLRTTPCGAVAQVLAAPQQPLSVYALGAALKYELRDILESSDAWTGKVTNKEKVLTVPAKGAGLARVRYEGKQEGAQRLKAKIWSKPAGKAFGRGIADLEVPMVYVTPINLQPREGDVKEITNVPKTLGFVCFSATRPNFNITAHEENNDPCFVVHCRPITGEEAAKDLGESLQNAPILGAYEVAVTVFESRNGRQLDFGQFDRKIIVESDLMPPMAVAIKGLVASDFKVIGGGAKQLENAISLEMFDADAGTNKTITFESVRPNVQLAVDSRQPDILQVEVGKPEPTPAGGQQWRIKVGVPKGALNGRMPPGSEIVLKTQDTPPRRIRIPVYGHAVIR